MRQSLYMLKLTFITIDFQFLIPKYNSKSKWNLKIR